jgi:hypothetical protein
LTPDIRPVAATTGIEVVSLLSSTIRQRSASKKRVLAGPDYPAPAVRSM